MSIEIEQDTPLRLSRRQFSACLIAGMIAHPAWAAEPSGTDLMLASYNASRFANARFSAELALATKTGSVQKRALKGVAKLVDQGTSSARLIKFASPADISGVATLTIERGRRADDLWIYLPSFRRVRRLVSSNRADPWVGSDFSLGDIVGHKVEDWRHALAGTDVSGAVPTWRIDSSPVNQTVSNDTGYSRRKSWLRKSDSALIKSEFYDHAGRLAKILIADDIRVLDAKAGKVQPMRLTMRNVQRGSASVMLFTSFRTTDAVSTSEVAPAALQS
ncbi:MAG: outer membrane lipoprotein-sorting protein [Chakrabartia sp.]